MTINMNDSHVFSISQLREFLKLGNSIQFQAVSPTERCQWINEVLNRFGYFKLRKKDKGIVRDYLEKMTGLSGAQLSRLIARKRKCGHVYINKTKRHRFPTIYDPRDIELLVETDNLHARLSGKATKEILGREYKLFNKNDFEKLARISVSHIYNLREKRQYQSHSLTVKGTLPSRNAAIGKREKPEPDGEPGYIRVDTVHQGDLEKEKGVYHINLVDEVTQWEIAGCVEKISERFLEPLLRNLIAQFPFKIINFHSDNGSEYINKVVAKLLNKLLIRQTKSRSRHSNDNALAECKNGSVIRKHMGYTYIDQKYAQPINQFYQSYFNQYLNYHRPCGYATTMTDKKGKQKKIYKTENYMTPYEKLKSISNAQKYLKENITFDKLDKIAYAESDNEFAKKMRTAKAQLFNQIRS